MNDFVSTNKPTWDELSQLLRRARRSVARLSPEELSRLDLLYRRTVLHLSQVATRTRDRRLIKHLNDLAASAHAVIYLPPRPSIWRGSFQFVVTGFARVVARTWRYHLLSAGLMILGGLLAYYVSSRDPLAAYAMLPAGDVRLPGSTPEQLLYVLRSGRDHSGSEKFLFSSFLFSHNLKVGLLAMGVGILAGIPTVLLMLYNGMILGAFTFVHHNAGIRAEFWAWILPHGVTELSAIALCGGVGLLLADAVVRPGWHSRAERLRQAGAEASKICVGVTGMLLFAAFIESYLRQSHLSTPARFAFSAATCLFWMLYLGHGWWLERWASRAGSHA